MGQGDNFRQLLISLKRDGQTSSDVGGFDGVFQPSSEVVVVNRSEDLRFSPQPPKRRTLDHAMAIEVERVAKRIIGLDVGASTGLGRLDSVGGVCLALR